jgi:hypothetical protein
MVWDEAQSARAALQVTYRIATAQGNPLSEQGGAVGAAPDGVEILEGFITDISNRKAAGMICARHAWLASWKCR